jgi:hypothetical protein
MSKVNPSVYLHVKAQQTNEQMKINTNKGVKRTKKLSNRRYVGKIFIGSRTSILK